MADLEDLLREMRDHRRETQSSFATLTERVDLHARACEERNRGAHARITEVKRDLDEDVRELRNRPVRRGVVAGAGGATGVLAVVEAAKLLLKGLFGNGSGG